MPDAVKVKIGGEEIELPAVLTFEQAETIWDAQRAISRADREEIRATTAAVAAKDDSLESDEAEDAFQKARLSGTQARLALVALLIGRPLPELKKQMTVEDMRSNSLRGPIFDLMVASGIWVAKEPSSGEAKPLETPAATGK